MCEKSNCRKLLIIIIILTIIKSVFTIKCYQCWSNIHRGCFSYDLMEKYLKPCSNDTFNNPVCRTISQVQYFTPKPDVTIVRECANLQLKPLTCTQSRFSEIHFSQVCECDMDGCNGAVSIKCINIIIIISLMFSTLRYICSN